MDHPLLLAFGFASPWLLWGLAAGALPIVIHLLHRRRYRDTPWAAMRFLQEALRKHSQRLQLEQLLLLAIRTLVLLLAAVVLARPFLSDLGHLFESSLPTHKVIVIDASLSMALAQGDETLFAHAKRSAREIVAAHSRGDVYHLVRLAALPPVLVVREPAYDPSVITQEIDQLTMPHARADLASSLAVIEPLLSQAADCPRKEVCIISDFQRSEWLGDDDADRGKIQQFLRRIAERARLVMLDVSRGPVENVAVTEFVALDTLHMVGRPTRLRASIKHLGGTRPAQQRLELLVDGRLAEQRRLDIPPGGEAKESFTVTFAQGGNHRLQLRLTGDAFPLDDQRYLAVSVRDRLRVLAVSGHDTGRPMGKATDYLEVALSPGGTSAGQGGRGLVDVHTISQGELQATDLARFDAVFLCNIPLVTQREAEQCDKFVERGGGLIVTLGDRVQSDSYNRWLYRDGKGVLPGHIGSMIGRGDRQGMPYEVDASDLAHPIVQVFQGNPDAGLETTRAYAYLKVDPIPNDTSKVALKFETGDPFLLEREYERGRCLLVTTSVDARWGNWSVWPSFLPLMQEAVLFVVSGQNRDRPLRVAERLHVELPRLELDADVSVTRPDGRQLPDQRVTARPEADFSYAETDLAGIYSVAIGPPVSRTNLFACNTDPRESDLSYIEKESYATDFIPGIAHSYLTQWNAADKPEPLKERESAGLSLWLLYLLAYLVAAEQLMAWNVRYGLLALCPPLWPVAAWRALRSNARFHA